ncbi:MAG: DUF1729 domain-containing protein [Deltaproteobacteria bacterium]|nr:DUF1729 domain-containing protein [Deltaproteobacteria bacterium]
MPPARRLVRGDATAALTFAGQGVDWASALGRDHDIPAWLALAERAIGEVADSREGRWSGLYDGQLDLGHLLAHDVAPAVLGQTPLSMPLIFLAQLAALRRVVRRGLGAAFEQGKIPVVTGYSQGLAAAVAVAERADGLVSDERLAGWLGLMARIGFHAARVTADRLGPVGDGVMALVVGPDLPTLRSVLADLGRDDVVIALHNDRKRHVVSGSPAGLAALRARLEALAKRQAELRAQGRHGGAVLTVGWEPVATTAAFHSPIMEEAVEAVLAWTRASGFAVAGAAARVVIDPSTGAPLAPDDPTRALVRSILVTAGHWQRTLLGLAGRDEASMVLDLGPEAGIGRLTAGVLRGTGVEVFALGDELERERFFSATDFDLPARAPARVRYADLAPSLARLPDGSVVVDNRFVRATGLPPVILPGMTPTTVDVPIVAAAANAGFMAELAGGGQVSEPIFQTRMAELRSALDPGVEVVFNALHLDAYLWGLHLGDKKLVQKARAAGAPLAGVTVSAGIPETQAAVALLDELARLGCRWNAFKPGTKGQIDQVLAIARAARHHTVFVHIEGGKAGGHHSWEDLEQLLLDSYHAIRAEPNVVLCVGGGIADEARGVELLTGRWSVRHGLVPMPVDAIFLGTLAMACAEATATAGVKAALTAAAGVDRWVGRGEVAGGVTSGRSQLDADIHYLDNAAARCGRLLDEVAGDAAKVATRKEEIVAALARTAKPYLGDVEAMTWAALVGRLFDLMVTRGRAPTRYEDGPWADVTWRARALDVVRRAEARLAGAAGLTTPVESVVADAGDLDDPEAVLARLIARWPEAERRLVGPTDATWFVREVCARPGKPVPFVPVIDQDVRRWYKSDSLWQAQDPRYDADQVLVIPGPEAVRGIRAENEPVAALLRRFDRALVADLEARGVAPTSVEDLGPARQPGRHPGQPSGPLAAFLVAPTVYGSAGPMDNPIARLLAPLDQTLARPLAQWATIEGTDRLVGARFDLGHGDLVALALRGDRIHLTLSHPTASALGGGAPLLELAFRAKMRGAHQVFVVERGVDDAVADYYGKVLFDRRPEPVALHAEARVTTTLEPARAAAYRRVTGAARPAVDGAGGAPDQVFTLAWPAIYRTLACPELASGLLRLVHLDNAVERLGAAAWPAPGANVDVAARVSRVEDHADHRVVSVVAELALDGAAAPAWRLRSTFHIRGAFASAGRVTGRERLEVTLVDDAAAREVLAAADGVTLEPTADWAVEGALVLTAELGEVRSPSYTSWTATGSITKGDRPVGRVALDSSAPHAEHPLRALVAVLGRAAAVRATPRRTLAALETRSPASMEAFADVGGDHNPIHTSGVAARLAGLDEPIVHGMWTGARLHAFAADALTGGDPARVSSVATRFLAPLRRGEPLERSLVRTGLEAGDRRVEATAMVRRGQAKIAVARSELRVAAPRTAWLFPGQGIQQPGMGQAAAQRSPAARAVWQRSDQICREALGFSLLRVVNENPTSLVVHGQRLFHPQGVLHLTQLTQVAMAALAQAQVAELEEAQAWTPDGLFAGHSVGEYNALAAAAKVLPLESVIALVYRRGSVMHQLVARDAEGRSGFAMGVVRPHLAGLDHAGADRLVREVAARTGGFLEIVNFNVRGRQYSVTGDTRALVALADALAARQKPGQKPAFVEVPGIDVPFHSSALAAGVAEFRASLEQHLPATIDADRLVGRYIPNLVARPFALTAAFVTAVRDAVQGPSRAALDALLADPATLASTDRGVQSRVARTLLVELLAWQFASPVRWIETQDLLMAGPTKVERIVEVGVGYQPTVANMARQTRELLRVDVEVLNAEAERAQVFAEDDDPPERSRDAGSALDQGDPEGSRREERNTRRPERSESETVAPAPKTSAPPPTTTTKPADAGLTHAEALATLLALQAKVRLDQIGPAETIDGLFDGVSSRRNQVLLDLGAEFDAGTIDRAHELAIAELATEVKKRAPGWRGPGAYLQKAHEDALKKALGRSGLSVAEAKAHLEASFGFGPGLVAATFDTLALEHRTGESVRGGALGALPDAPASKDQARAMLDRAALALGQRRGTTYGKLGQAAATATAAADPAALRALEERLFGPRGLLTRAADALRGEAQIAADAPVGADLATRLADLEGELGQEVLEATRPLFDARRHVAFTSSWASAHRDLVRACYRRLNADAADAGADAALADTLTRLAPHARHPRCRMSADWFASLAERRGLTSMASALSRFTATDSPVGAVGAYTNQAALVTGAGPGSIAIEVVARLLAGGARVVVTTSNDSRERIAGYRALYERHAAPGAELHVLPFNQASLGDLDALVDWLLAKERANLQPDLLVPFAAIKDWGTADQLGAKALVAFRAMVLATERLVGRLGHAYAQAGEGRRCHVLLPLSPNHGAFGGDGAYAETKAALEALLAKWKSERHAWGRGTTIVGARIGWVRGTGLMAGNDKVAPRLEATTGIRTFDNGEMADLLVGLCDAAHRERAAQAPIVADLTGGFDRVPDLKAAVDGVRESLARDEAHAARVSDLARRIAERITPPVRVVPTITPLPDWPVGAAPEPDGSMPWPAPVTTSLEDMVCIVGFGEVGPGGSARTRFDLELSRTRPDGRLSPPAVLELAWLMGLVRWQESGRGGSWIDVASEEPVPESSIVERYHDRVRQGLGVRFVEPAVTGFDPERSPVLEKVFLEQDFTFRVGSEAEARAFLDAAPDTTRVRPDGDQWSVTRLAGTEIRVPRTQRLTRRVAGQLPSGLTLARYGFPGEMLASVDPVALMNVAATVESFVAAGTTPEELLRWVHPARVGNTQGSGMGGMRSLQRLYVDHLLGHERQSDVLQETLINVVFAYATSSWVGSYGPMAHPVAACATAALSIEDACDKIACGKADVVMAGGWDDLSAEGVIGFGDMNATAETDAMLAMGLAPDQMSRANDRRRKGFVEAQGGGALLLARGDVALAMGLPVYGVVAYAASFGDGINRSIPAPGIGSLAAAIGGRRSPLARALGKLGLTADDVALVSKHDTSTAANDPNESGIHQELQRALGRTPGNPLLVVSQKAVLGHAKGGAAAWQAIGLCQSLAAGAAPGNPNLESVDPQLEAHDHLVYSSQTITPGPACPMRAGLLTSLGFGHVSALVCVAHPAAFLQAVPEGQRAAWLDGQRARKARAVRRLAQVITGREPLYKKVAERRFAAADGTAAQKLEETAMLLDPGARLDPATGTFSTGEPA